MTLRPYDRFPCYLVNLCNETTSSPSNDHQNERDGYHLLIAYKVTMSSQYSKLAPCCFALSPAGVGAGLGTSACHIQRQCSLAHHASGCLHPRDSHLVIWNLGAPVGLLDAEASAAGGAGGAVHRCALGGLIYVQDPADRQLTL